MYWSKIATTEEEFTAIAKLNYATFVEEIPQHEYNESGTLIDKYHDENTYVIVYKKQELIGMVAFRDNRPFSLDNKIGTVENHLPSQDCEKLCEVRLLAVKQGFRNGRVFTKLATALFRHFFNEGYTACVISGTIRQQKLYEQMGFRQFAEAVGTEEASYLPMVLTRTASMQFRARLNEERIVFYPGPVEHKDLIAMTPISHRSPHFIATFTSMRSRLLQLSGANDVITLVGTGTLANDAMLGQLKSDQPERQALFLVNGEFGERLYKQALRWQISAEKLQYKWGTEIDLMAVEASLASGRFASLVFVHGETSSGTLNPLERLAEIANLYGVEVYVDCISSFGALPFSLQNVRYATAVSGKSLGTISGLTFIFLKQAPTTSDAPTYLNLVHYVKRQIPFTLPYYLVKAVEGALGEYPGRYELLAQRLSKIENSALAPYFLETTHYPMIATLQLPSNFKSITELNGFYLHGDSDYLKQRGWTQISTIQPSFEHDFKKLLQLLEYTIK